jgi:hypothetical protein
MNTPDRFSREFRSRMPVHAFSAAGLVFLGAAIWKLWLIHERGGGDYLLLGYYALFGAWLVSMFPGRSRPILEITADEIRYGSAMWPGRRSVRIDEVVEVGEPSQLASVVRLRLRSGEQIRLRLGEIRAAERAEALASIRAAIAAV